MRKRKSKSPVTRKDTSQKARKKAVVKRKKVDKKPKDGYFRNIYYESLQEKYTLAWLFELKDLGYISEIKRGVSFLLSDAVMNNYVQQQKRGSKPMSQIILRGHSYTDDFIVIVNQKALGKFFWELGSNTKYNKTLLICNRLDGSLVCRIETKPRYNRSASDSLPKAVDNMKWVFQKYGIFVNLFIPEEHFERTFVPQEYRKTEAGRDRLIKFKALTLKEYIENERTNSK
jgi:hypothetical protein